MASPEFHQEHRHNPSQDQASPKNETSSLARPDRTWADNTRDSPGHNVSLAIRHPTFHTIAKDVGYPYPFATNPHLLIIGRYSRKTDNLEEIVFKHVYPARHAETRKLLQRYRTRAPSEIRKRLVINLFYTDTLGDTYSHGSYQKEHQALRRIDPDRRHPGQIA